MWSRCKFRINRYRIVASKRGIAPWKPFFVPFRLATAAMCWSVARSLLLNFLPGLIITPMSKGWVNPVTSSLRDIQIFLIPRAHLLNSAFGRTAMLMKGISMRVRWLTCAMAESKGWIECWVTILIWTDEQHQQSGLTEPNHSIVDWKVLRWLDCLKINFINVAYFRLHCCPFSKTSLACGGVDVLIDYLRIISCIQCHEWWIGMEMPHLLSLLLEAPTSASVKHCRAWAENRFLLPMTATASSSAAALCLSWKRALNLTFSVKAWISSSEIRSSLPFSRISSERWDISWF